MRSGTSFELPTSHGDIAASEYGDFTSFYVTDLSNNEVRCLTRWGSEVASYEDQEKIISCPTLAPGELLFCVLSDEDEYTLDEIIALDAQTMQPRYRFGLSLLNCPCGVT